MTFIMCICLALLIALAMFHKEFRAAELSLMILFLSLALVALLFSLAGITPVPFIKGPSSMFAVGGCMIIMLTNTTTFKVLRSIPASAYKAIAPAAICVGVLVLLGLAIIL